VRQPVRTYMFLHHSAMPDMTFNELEVGVSYDDGTSIVRKFALDGVVVDPHQELGDVARDILVGLAEQL